MGMVGLTLKVMPENSEIDIRELKNKIAQVQGVRQIDEKPIGFGLVVLEVLLVFDDKTGAGDAEEKIACIEGVGNVESGDVTLIS